MPINSETIRLIADLINIRSNLEALEEDEANLKARLLKVYNDDMERADLRRKEGNIADAIIAEAEASVIHEAVAGNVSDEPVEEMIIDLPLSGGQIKMPSRDRGSSSKPKAKKAYLRKKKAK